MKVVRLLQDMQQELTASLEDDKAVYEQLACWCKTNDREKTAAIEGGEQKESQLKAYLGEAVAKMVEFKSKRDATLDEVNRDEAAMQQASNFRMQANKEFHVDETNLIEAIKACDQAIGVLKEYNPKPSLLQATADRLRSARILELGTRLWGARAVPYASVLRSFLSQANPANSFLAIPGYQSYAPRSGQIYGVLEQMKEDFEKDLAEAQTKESTEANEFATLKAAKQEEIATGRQLQAALDVEIAELKRKHAQAFKELEDTQAQLDLDRTFLAHLKERCAQTDIEFDTRVKDRMAEIAAVAETIQILNEDKSFDNFARTVNTAFLQVLSRNSAAEEDRLARAADALRRGAALSREPRLALLAARTQLDAFTKVKAEIDKMVEELRKQQQDEVAHRDWCIDEFNKNNRSSEENYDRKVNLEAKIADLEKTMEYLKEEIQATTDAVADMQEQMKRASEVREAENADYQQTVTDHRITQMILAKAHDRMKQIYALIQADPQPGAPHVALSGNHTDPGNGPARFTKYDKHSGGSRVLRMIEEVMADSKKTEDDAIASEQDSQAKYESFMQESNTAITAYARKIVSMKGALARVEEDSITAKSDLMATVRKLDDLHETLGALKGSCDFILKNFAARQEARAVEIEALREAKSILSGMK
mmetsp:Transcript_123318/g.354314  ORF Transcript_123318/g.354314 Transcript_123318/m.354314 type:complete len:654 (+) Transcript_123318:1-1962(+)